MITLPVIALTVAKRRGWPVRQPSPKKIPISMNRNDGLFSSLRYDCDLDLAVLHIKDGIRRISLKEHSLILAIFRYRPSTVHAGEKDFKVEGVLFFGFHDDGISAIHLDHEVV